NRAWRPPDGLLRVESNNDRHATGAHPAQPDRTVSGLQGRGLSVAGQRAGMYCHSAPGAVCPANEADSAWLRPEHPGRAVTRRKYEYLVDLLGAASRELRLLVERRGSWTEAHDLQRLITDARRGNVSDPHRAIADRRRVERHVRLLLQFRSKLWRRVEECPVGVSIATVCPAAKLKLRRGGEEIEVEGHCKIADQHGKRRSGKAGDASLARAGCHLGLRRRR